MKKTNRAKFWVLLIGMLLLLNAFGYLGVMFADAQGLFNHKGRTVCDSVLERLRIYRLNVNARQMAGFTIIAGAMSLSLTMACLGKDIRAKMRNKGVKGVFAFFWAIVCLCVIAAGWVVGLWLATRNNLSYTGILWCWLYYGMGVACGAVIVLTLTAILRLLCLGIPRECSVESNAVSIAANGEQETEKEENVFPGIYEIDEKYEGQIVTKAKGSAKIDLPTLAEGFQAFLSQRYELYYDLHVLRSFLAGLSASRLIILEGLSGTGKSSLPRYFAEYVGCNAFFVPVQSTWRDRNDLLGYYSDFTKVFKETNFLKRLYEASYTPDNFNMMVLDEMNLSRVEYYFADFLSVLEYPSEDWTVQLTQGVPDAKAPALLEDGAIRIPVNTWFIGTANKDDSTFTITDKVYDRAIVLDFDERNRRIESKANPNPISLSPAQLQNLFAQARKNPENCLTHEELDQFIEFTQYVYDLFEVQFGNRILNQIIAFTPVFVAMGGTKVGALDVMFCRKILHKVEGRFEDYIKEGLIKLQSKIASVYGVGQMPETEEMIARLLKKLI